MIVQNVYIGNLFKYRVLLTVYNQEQR